MTVLEFERRRVRMPADLSQWADDECRIPEFHLGDRMGKAMELAGMGVGDMAEIFDVNRNTVSRWINGRTEPKRAIVMMWADGCGVDFEWLQTGQPSETAIALRELRARGDVEHRSYPSGVERGSVNQSLTPNRRARQTWAVAA